MSIKKKIKKMCYFNSNTIIYNTNHAASIIQEKVYLLWLSPCSSTV